jgi:hypothetical protein
MDLNTYEISAHFTCCNADLSLSKVNCSKKKVDEWHDAI